MQQLCLFVRARRPAAGGILSRARLHTRQTRGRRIRRIAAGQHRDGLPSVHGRRQYEHARATRYADERSQRAAVTQ
jgi:hypothetical protein